mmetsp:Transcript_12918/g.26177  ORF Transcript_12918/g.26177 Transcript_12918/m.26177 type:complete len:365 (-) Transcript_12918:139-1233(-)
MRLAGALALLFVAQRSTAALFGNPLALELFGRPALEAYLQRRQLSPALTWSDAKAGSCQLPHDLWAWLDSDSQVDALALPNLDKQQLRALSDLPPAAVERLGIQQLELLPDDAPVAGLVCVFDARVSVDPSREGEKREVVLARSRAWVQRTLAPGPLAFCPYTGSETTSGNGLEALGVTPAPIHYAVSSCGDLMGLMRSFWAETGLMLSRGQQGCSSIILSAPCWDDRWRDWCELVFPTLERSVLSAGLGRTLGIVCFHPDYSTPDPIYLARNRFGHMHSTERLRRWLEEADAPLSQRTEDPLLHWAGSYQRRSPHAMINVLWAEQLEVAETKRKSSILYSRNVAKVLGVGREQLERESARERL